MGNKKTKGRKYGLTVLKQSPGGKHLVWSKAILSAQGRGPSGQSEEWPDERDGLLEAEGQAGSERLLSVSWITMEATTVQTVDDMLG